MRKRKQKKGNVSQTVIVNVAKSGARGRAPRGAPRGAPRANTVVTYTDQTPLLNLVKEFTQNNRLMLEGSRDNITRPTEPRLSIAPDPRLLIPQTIDPSIGPAQRLSMNRLTPPNLPTLPNLPKTLDPMNRSSTLDPMNRSSFGKLLPIPPKRSRSVSPPRAPPKPTRGLATPRDTPRKNRASPPPIPTKGLARTRAPRSVNRYEI